MATTLYSGQSNVKANDNTTGAYTFYLEVILNSQSVENNTSNITINHYAKGNLGYYYSDYSSPKSYIKIYDSKTETTNTKKTTTVKSIPQSKTKIGTWTGDIEHKSDGTLTINVTAEYKANDSTWYLPANKSISSGNLVLNPLHKVPLINSVAFTENNQDLIDAGIDDDTFVARLSNKTVNADITFYDNATLSQLVTVVSTTSYTSSTNPMTIDMSNCNIGGNTTLIILQATDTLNATGSYGITKTAIPYNLPTLIPTSSNIKRNGQTTGKAKMSLKGTFYNANVGNVSNAVQLQFAYWENGDTESQTYYTIPSSAYTINDNDITMSNWNIAISGTEITDLDEAKSYTFRIKITDSFNKTFTMDLLCPNGEYIYSLYKDRVDFKKLTIQNEVILRPVTLYEDANDEGTNGTVTLSESAANYDYLEIYYYVTTRDVYGDNSIKISKPNGKYATLTCDGYTNSYHYITIGTLLINANKLTWQDRVRTRIANNGASTITANVTTIYITKVIGYKS